MQKKQISIFFGELLCCLIECEMENLRNEENRLNEILNMKQLIVLELMVEFVKDVGLDNSFQIGLSETME
ncbi:hypothetical protein SNEBB_002492 [Seison nebaliae]|nr:hypothetical protein SNEBB_002492 [Seison nebaliae]